MFHRLGCWEITGFADAPGDYAVWGAEACKLRTNRISRNASNDSRPSKNPDSDNCCTEEAHSPVRTLYKI